MAFLRSVFFSKPKQTEDEYVNSIVEDLKGKNNVQNNLISLKELFPEYSKKIKNDLIPVFIQLLPEYNKNDVVLSHIFYFLFYLIGPESLDHTENAKLILSQNNIISILTDLLFTEPRRKINVAMKFIKRLTEICPTEMQDKLISDNDSMVKFFTKIQDSDPIFRQDFLDFIPLFINNTKDVQPIVGLYILDQLSNLIAPGQDFIIEVIFTILKDNDITQKLFIDSGYLKKIAELIKISNKNAYELANNIFSNGQASKYQHQIIASGMISACIDNALMGVERKDNIDILSVFVSNSPKCCSEIIPYTERIIGLYLSDISNRQSFFSFLTNFYESADIIDIQKFILLISEKFEDVQVIDLFTLGVLIKREISEYFTTLIDKYVKYIEQAIPIALRFAIAVSSNNSSISNYLAEQPHHFFTKLIYIMTDKTSRKDVIHLISLFFKTIVKNQNKETPNFVQKLYVAIGDELFNEYIDLSKSDSFDKWNSFESVLCESLSGWKLDMTTCIQNNYEEQKRINCRFADLQKCIETLKEENKELQNNLSLLEEKKNLKIHFTNRHDFIFDANPIEHTRSEEKEHSVRVELLNNQIMELKTIYQHALLEIEQKDSAIEDISKANTDLSNSKVELISQVSELSQQNSKISNQYNKLLTEYEKQNQEIQNLQNEKIPKNGTESDILSRNTSEEHRNQIVCLENEIKVLNNRIKELEADKISKNGENSKLLSSEINKFNIIIHEKDKEIEKLQEQSFHQKEVFDQLNDRFDKLNDECSQLRINLNRVNQNEKKHDSNEEDINAINERYKSLKEENNLKDQKINSLELNVKSLQKQRKNYEQIIMKLEKENKKFELQNSRLNSQLNTNIPIEEYKAINELKNVIDQRNEEIAQLKIDVSKLDADNDSLSKEVEFHINAFEVSRREHTKEIALLEMHMNDDFLKFKQKTKEDMLAKDRKITQLEITLRQAQEKLVKYENSKLQYSSIRLQANIDELEKRVRIVCAENEVLRRKVSKMKTSNSSPRKTGQVLLRSSSLLKTPQPVRSKSSKKSRASTPKVQRQNTLSTPGKDDYEKAIKEIHEISTIVSTLPDATSIAKEVSQLRKSCENYRKALINLEAAKNAKISSLNEEILNLKKRQTELPATRNDDLKKAHRLIGKMWIENKDHGSINLGD